MGFLDTTLDIGSFGAHSLIKKKTGIGLGDDPNKKSAGKSLGGLGGFAANEQRKRKLAELAKGRERDLSQGFSKGKELFNDKDFKGVNTRQTSTEKDIIAQRKQISDTAGTQSKDIGNVLAQRRANLAGFTPEEMTAMREQNIGNFQKQQAGQLRQLRASQGASGIRGGLAAAQQANLVSQGAGAQANAERDLFLAQQAQKREALGQLEGSARSAETERFGRRQEALGGLEGTAAAQRQTQFDRAQYNQDLRMRQMLGQQATGFGYAQLGAAEKAQVGQEQLGQQQLQAAMLMNQPKRKVFGIF